MALERGDGSGDRGTCYNLTFSFFSTLSTFHWGLSSILRTLFLLVGKSYTRIWLKGKHAQLHSSEDEQKLIERFKRILFYESLLIFRCM